jgi:succinyl-diaminopimelate desuccinylase
MSLEEKEILRILQDLIRAKSPNPPGDVSACTAVISALLRNEGIPFEVDESQPGIKNIVATLKGSRGPDGSGKSLMFNGHIDVIPAGDGWKTDPFEPVFENGYVIGRGTVDMKSGIAAMLSAMISLKRQGAPFTGTLLLMAVGDEEYHSEFGTKYLLRKGLKSDFAICCEPTDLGLDLGNRGLLMIDVVVKGKASHAGRPALGVNAIHIASTIIAHLARLSFSGHHNDAFEYPDGCASVVEVNGGAKINVIPDRCSFYIDRRLMPGESGKAATEEIAGIISALTGIVPDIGEDHGSSIVMYPESWHEPCWTPAENPVVASAIKCYRAMFQKEPKIGGKSAGTDASHLVSMARIPTLILGPGNFKLSHTVGEKVLFSQVVDASRLYESIVRDFLK